MTAMGLNEIQWAKAYAKPQINPYRSIETPENPDDYISLLEMYLQLTPHISPGPFRTSLSHPDLHLDNIFVDPHSKKITCLIDWQSASVSEPFLQHNLPRMLLPVEPRSYKEGSEDTSQESNGSKNLHGPVDLLRHYQNLTKLMHEERWAAINIHNRSLLTDPVSLLCGAWSRNDVFSFRHALIRIAARWKEIAPVMIPCPLQFTDQELELHKDELELLEDLSEVLHQLQNDNLIPLGGMVLRENYLQTLHINNNVRDMFVSMAETESQKALYSSTWPYQERDP